MYDPGGIPILHPISMSHDLRNLVFVEKWCKAQLFPMEICLENFSSRRVIQFSAGKYDVGLRRDVSRGRGGSGLFMVVPLTQAANKIREAMLWRSSLFRVPSSKLARRHPLSLALVGVLEIEDFQGKRMLTTGPLTKVLSDPLTMYTVLVCWSGGEVLRSRVDSKSSFFPRPGRQTGLVYE